MNTTTYELRTENNPAHEQNETAIYFGGVHCGYGKTTLEAEKIAQEIKAKREAATPKPTTPRRKIRKAPRTEIHETPMQNAVRDELGISAFVQTHYEFVSGQKPAVHYQGIVTNATTIEGLGPFMNRFDAEAAVNARCSELVVELAARLAA